MKGYEWELLGNYGYGWDILTTEETKAGILQQLATYRREEGALYKVRRVKA